MNILSHATPSALYNEKLAADRQRYRRDAYEFARMLFQDGTQREGVVVYWQERAAREHRAIAKRLNIEAQPMELL